MKSGLKCAVLALALLGGIGCDQAAKLVATSELRGQAPRSLLWGGLELRYAENTGGFLGLGVGLPARARYLAFVIAVGGLLLALSGFALRDPALALPQFLALVSIVVGGAGNLLDRVALGYVRDFALVRVGPLSTGVFNTADVAVTLGSVALVLTGWRRGRRA